MREQILGVNEHKNVVTIAELDEANVIKKLTVYQLIDKQTSYDNNYYLSWSGSGFSEVKGTEFEHGQKLSKNFKPKIAKKLLATIESAYKTNGHNCEECGTFHDNEQDYDLSYVMTDHGEVYCKSCASIEDLLTEVTAPSDLFSARDITGTNVPKEYKEVATLFCDSSGFGSDSERALTKQGAEARVDKLLQENGTLYAGLTGIGQFQVYVTLYKKIKTKKSKNARRGA